MGGGGSMQAMNESLKKNRALVKSRLKFKGLGDKTESGKKLVFKKTRDVDMHTFKKKLQKEKINKNRKKIVAIILSIIATLLLLYYSDILIGKYFSGDNITW